MKKTTSLALGVTILGGSILSGTTFAQVADSNESISKPAFEQSQKGKRHGFWKNWKQDVTKTITKVDGGVSITMTTENETVLAKLLEREAKSNDKMTVTINKLSNGITVTTTSDDSEIAARLQSRADKQIVKDSINKVVENLDNGVKVTITSDNAEAVAKIQEKELKESNHENITKSVTNLSNGVEMVITSSDESMVERIQKRAERGGHKGGKGKKGKMKQAGEQRQDRSGEKRGLGESVERVVTNITNGVIITMSSDDADVIEKIQTRKETPREQDGVNHSIVNTSNGVEITVTSDDPELVEKIQQRSEKGGKGKKRDGRKGGPRGFQNAEQE